MGRRSSLPKSTQEIVEPAAQGVVGKIGQSWAGAAGHRKTRSVGAGWVGSAGFRRWVTHGEN